MNCQTLKKAKRRKQQICMCSIASRFFYEECCIYAYFRFCIFRLPEDSLDEDMLTIEREVQDYLATLRRGVKERHLKVFMEQLSSNLVYFSNVLNSENAISLLFLSLFKKMICSVRWIPKHSGCLPCSESKSSF